MADEITHGDSGGDDAIVRAAELSHSFDQLQLRADQLTISANGFARAMSQAFTQSVVGGKQFDDVLKSLALRLSNMAVAAAFKPLARGRDGRLGVAASGSRAASVTINIATPDLDGFRRSETYLTGQIARAVARGQRGL